MSHPLHRSLAYTALLEWPEFACLEDAPRKLATRVLDDFMIVVDEAPKRSVFDLAVEYRARITANETTDAGVLERYALTLIAGDEALLLCLDRKRDACSGPVEYRESLSGTGMPIARCERHWERRLDQDAQHRRTYPDSPTPPSWFDPTFAGESWDES